MARFLSPTAHSAHPLSLLTTGLVAASANAQWEVPPAYTLPTAPTVARAGTVGAIADNSNSLTAYGPAQTFYRATGSSYSGMGTTVLGTTLTVGTSTTTPILGSARPQFGSSAWIRAGKASADSTVSMQWRTATQFETYGSSVGTEANPGPMPDSAPWNTLASDVVKITGIAATGSLDGQGRLPTDAYTLELTFDPGLLVASYQNFDTYGWTLNDIIAAGELQLGYFDPITGVWSKQVNVIAPGASRVQNFLGSWDSFATTYGANDNNLADYVGSWGIVVDSANPTNSRVWAVLDHTSSYAVVPAPAAFALVGAAALAAGRRRRA
jgi:hypothetical protein